MALKVLSEESLEENRALKEQLEAKDAQLQQLGFALTEEKVKNAQKEVMLNQLGAEVTQIKIKVIQLEGVVGQ